MWYRDGRAESGAGDKWFWVVVVDVGGMAEVVWCVGEIICEGLLGLVWVSSLVMGKVEGGAVGKKRGRSPPSLLRFIS